LKPTIRAPETRIQKTKKKKKKKKEKKKKRKEELRTPQANKQGIF
jgi:hypothetical protein